MNLTEDFIDELYSKSPMKIYPTNKNNLKSYR